MLESRSVAATLSGETLIFKDGGWGQGSNLYTQLQWTMEA
jgi:hypothetical protein